MSGADRIARRFASLKQQGRGGLVTFVTAGDPDLEHCYDILRGLPGAGADIIELGMPFTDPMADGPAIQAANLRALKAGTTLKKTLNLVRLFRSGDGETPLVLMGYYNPIHHYGVEAFLKDAVEAGVDGLIIVDLPPEEDQELCLPARAAGLAFIRLATPTTDARRLPQVLNHATGFIYYVAIAGITGTASAATADVAGAVARLRAGTDLPIAVGFGLKSAEDVAATFAHADAAVVGSAIVRRIEANLDGDGRPKPGLTEDVLALVRELSPRAA